LAKINNIDKKEEIVIKKKMNNLIYTSLLPTLLRELRYIIVDLRSGVSPDGRDIS